MTAGRASYRGALMRIAIALVASLVAVSVSFAQATSGIVRGTVTDPSGAAVAQEPSLRLQRAGGQEDRHNEPIGRLPDDERGAGHI